MPPRKRVPRQDHGSGGRDPKHIPRSMQVFKSVEKKEKYE